MKSSRSHKKHRSSMSSSSRQSQKELPRKTAKIRRTYPEPGVEKTELRFVLYKEPGGKYRREKFLNEVADFLNEQGNRLADGEQIVKTPEKQPPKKLEKKSEKRSPKKNWEVETEPGIILVKDIVDRQERHHEQNCQRARAIRISLPVIKRLLERIRELNNKNNVELEAIQKTAQQVYDDAERCLATGGAVGENLSDRMTRLQVIANKVLTDVSNQKKTKKPARKADSYSSFSDVNAVSHGESSIKMMALHRRRQ